MQFKKDQTEKASNSNSELEYKEYKNNKHVQPLVLLLKE